MRVENPVKYAEVLLAIARPREGYTEHQKITENITDANGYKEQWNSAAFGPLLSLKLLIPLDEGTNFILSANGGYYVLLGSGVSITGPSISENADLSAANWGGRAGVSLEFFLDDHKNTSLDLGLDYQYLKFSPVTAKISASGPVSFASTLTNNDGSNAMVDFTGVRMGASVRFYLGKDYD